MDIPWFEIVVLSLLGVAVAFDLAKREIPDWIPLALLIWATAAIALSFNTVGWGNAGLGAGTAIVVGLGMFCWAQFGGGDVKLLVALGACLGFVGLLNVLFWMALVGAAIALLAAARGKRDLAYAPAIAAGVLVYFLSPSLLAWWLLG